MEEVQMKYWEMNIEKVKEEFDEEVDEEFGKKLRNFRAGGANLA